MATHGILLVLLYLGLPCFSYTLLQRFYMHSVPDGRKTFSEIMDHTSIYFFIAGTYTPFLFLAVDGWVGWTLFGVVWGLAIGGTVFKAFFVKKFLFTSTLLYLVMGWLIVFVWNDLVVNLHPTSLVLLAIGGMCYTVGAIFYMWRIFKHHHAVWHVFVLGGTVCHFFGGALFASLIKKMTSFLI